MSFIYVIEGLCGCGRPIAPRVPNSIPPAPPLHIEREGRRSARVFGASIHPIRPRRQGHPTPSTEEREANQAGGDVCGSIHRQLGATAGQARRPMQMTNHGPPNARRCSASVRPPTSLLPYDGRLHPSAQLGLRRRKGKESASRQSKSFVSWLVLFKWGASVPIVCSVLSKLSIHTSSSSYYYSSLRCCLHSHCTHLTPSHHSRDHRRARLEPVQPQLLPLPCCT